MKEDHAMVDRIKTAATQEGCELACCWELPHAYSSNLLEKGLQTNSTNVVRQAMSLLGSAVAPFVRAAKLIKNCFKDVLGSHPGIVEETLMNNSLVVKACQLRIHVNTQTPV